MDRKNVVGWNDCVVLTRKCGELLEAMMKYQMYTYPSEKQGSGLLGGDRIVLVAAIELRNRLDVIIEKSRKANA